MRNSTISTFSKGGGHMQKPEVVEQVFALKAQGNGQKTIARELGISRNTVKKYLKQKCWQPYKKSKKPRSLDGLEKWLEETFLQHKGNSAVVHQELKTQFDIEVDKSTVRKAVRPFRKKLAIEAVATIRFETPPGKQMQMDFGSMKVRIDGEPIRVYFFAAVLGYSRRQCVHASLNESQISWFKGIESAFHHFNGISQEILLDNARALVSHHNPLTREVRFNERFHAFARYWGFTPKACAPYRARTKGKVESTVKYIKMNAIAGHEFKSLEALQSHLDTWMREVSDTRIHGTTHERPIDRFQTEEIQYLSPLGKPPFHQIREVQRIVQSE